MPRIITIGIAPNAFKGSLGAQAAAQAIADGLERSCLPCHCLLMPLADGGDGTLAVLLGQSESRRIQLTVENALGEPIQADYGLLADGQTAVIEMAQASGLAQLGGRTDPLHASTYGTGQLMRHAIEAGATRLLVGVGGSATTDGGAGCLQALGVGLLDIAGNPIGRGGIALGDLAQVIPTPLLDSIQMSVLCDVENPPVGPQGAAAIFGPQKGATPSDVTLLDSQLFHFFKVVAEQGGRDVRPLVGGGAAGALAGGLAALVGATLVAGAATIIETLGYAEQVARCDLLITGEGRWDDQTTQGKGPVVVARLAAQHGIPVIVLAGQVPSAATLLDGPVQAAFSLLPHPASLDETISHAAEWLSDCAFAVGQTLALGYNLGMGNKVG